MTAAKAGRHPLLEQSASFWPPKERPPEAVLMKIGLRRQRRCARDKRQNPKIIIAHVDGSGSEPITN